MMARWPNYRTEKTKGERETRLEAALRLIAFIEQSGMTLEEITVAIDRLIKQPAKRKAA